MKFSNNAHDNLRHTSQFFGNPTHSVYNGIESASYLGPNLWKQIPSEIRNKKSLKGFKRERSRNANQRTVLVEFVKSLYQTWSLYKLYR